MPNQNAVRTRRRWLPRFGLRTLLLVVTAIGVLLGSAMFWYRLQEAEYEKQVSFADGILQHHGRVTWESCAPTWLQWAGEWQIFRRISGVAFGDNAAVASSLAKLHDMANVRGVLIPHEQLDGNMINYLAKMEHVQFVHIRFSDYWSLNSDDKKEIDSRSMQIGRLLKKEVRWGPGDEPPLSQF